MPFDIPNSWEWTRIESICREFLDGDWIESKDQSDKGIRLIQTGNIGNGVFKDKEKNHHYISEETFRKLNCTEIFPGDILVSRLPEPVGRSCEIPDIKTKMITAVDCTIIRLEKECIDKKYFCYFTQSNNYFSQVSDLCAGTTRKRISKMNLVQVRVPLPPLAEQKRIASKIESLFSILDAMENECD